MKNDMKKAINELEKHKEQLLRELDAIENVLECSLKNYDFMIDFAVERDYERVIDIGCAFGLQSVLCNDRVEYIGIDEDKVNFYNNSENIYYARKYPCYIPTYYYDSLAISNLAVGWQCYVNDKEFKKQCKALSKDFKACLLYIPEEREEILRKYFKTVEIVKKNESKIIPCAMYYCYNHFNYF